jgi:hypothetical protein
MNSPSKKLRVGGMDWQEPRTLRPPGPHNLNEALDPVTAYMKILFNMKTPTGEETFIYLILQ